MCSNKSFSKYTRNIFIVLIIALSAMTTSCTRRIGWGIVIWGKEGSDIKTGEIVPVYFKSNITRSYGVSLLNSKKIEEIELWRIEFYKTKSKAKKASLEYGDLLTTFGISKRNGLILREEAKNTAEQVYKLRIDQEIKLLKKVQGQVVETGGKALEGSWYYAVASDGTHGYIFSNQLAMWNTSTEERPSLTQSNTKEDKLISNFLITTWRPSYFDTMIKNKTIDLNSFSASLGLFPDAKSSQVRVSTSDFSAVYNVSQFEKIKENTYKLSPEEAIIRFNSNGSITLEPNDPKLEDPDKTYTFTAQKEDIYQIVTKEQQRQLSVLSAFVDISNNFISLDGGDFSVTKTRLFHWYDYENLVPTIIPEGCGNSGNIDMDLFVSSNSNVNGAFTLTFDNQSKTKICFAYRFLGDSMILSYISPDNIENAIVKQRSFTEDIVFYY